MASSYSLAVLFVLLAIYCVRSVRNHRTLEQFRGPWLAGYTRLWLLRANTSGSMHTFFKDVNDKYGKIAEGTTAASEQTD